MPIRYKFRSRVALQNELRRLAWMMGLKAESERDLELKAFYNGKSRAFIEIDEILAVAEIDGMENPT